jgi:hypothetical protein
MPFDDSQLAAHVHHALLREWDPIGIQQFTEAEDEYDSYVPDVCKLLREHSTAKELIHYLWWLETVHMGLPGNRERTEAFAARLVESTRAMA